MSNKNWQDKFSKRVKDPGDDKPDHGNDKPKEEFPDFIGDNETSRKPDRTR